MKRLCIAAVLVVLALGGVGVGQTGQKFTINELLKVRRVSDPQVSPD